MNKSKFTTLLPPSNMRPVVGFKDVVPQKAAGVLRLPPTSVPSPRIDPPEASNAASPLEEPPGDLDLSKGLVVVPYTGFELPKLYMVWGMFVKQKGFAPRAFNL